MREKLIQACSSAGVLILYKVYLQYNLESAQRQIGLIGQWRSWQGIEWTTVASNLEIARGMAGAGSALQEHDGNLDGQVGVGKAFGVWD